MSEKFFLGVGTDMDHMKAVLAKLRFQRLKTKLITNLDEAIDFIRNNTVVQLAIWIPYMVEGELSGHLVAETANHRWGSVKIVLVNAHRETIIHARVKICHEIRASIPDREADAIVDMMSPPM